MYHPVLNRIATQHSKHTVPLLTVQNHYDVQLWAGKTVAIPRFNSIDCAMWPVAEKPETPNNPRNITGDTTTVWGCYTKRKHSQYLNMRN